jgi:short subunit dehydrogenase-like uncharacterized protein
VKEVQFRDRSRATVAIPWGDVSTAYHSTGIPNIVIYTSMPPKAIARARLARPLLGLTRFAPVMRAFKAVAQYASKGSSAEQIASGESQFWGRVSRPDGAAVEGTLTTPEGYILTAHTSVDAAKRVAAGEVPPGTRTPSMAFGASYVTRFERCDLRIAAPPKAQPAAASTPPR